MIPVIGRNLGIAVGRLLFLSIVIFFILRSAGTHLVSGLSFAEFLKAAFSGRLVNDPSQTGLPPLRPALLYSATALLWALLFSYGIGLPLGLVLGRYRTVWVQVLGHAAISVAMAIPAFWVAYVVLFYSINHWGIFIGGAPKMEGEGWLDELVAKSLLLGVPLSLSGLAIVARQVSQALMQASPEQTLLFARSLGLLPRTVFDLVIGSVIWRPLLRSLPLLCSLFMSILIVVETAFFVPGFGYSLYKAAKESDLQSLAVLSLWVTAGLLAANFVVDVLIEVIDARHPPSPGVE
jgi:ABC-type dipeptide/oligopeptide/nickel transport system permease component